MSDILRDLEEFIEIYSALDEIEIEALYFSKKNLVVKISTDKPLNKHENGHLLQDRSERNVDSTRYFYVLKMHPESRIEPYISYLNKLIWSNKNYKKQGYISKSNLITDGKELSELLRISKTNFYSNRYEQSQYNHNYFSDIEKFFQKMKPDRFRIPALIIKNDKYLVLEYVEGMNLSALTYSLETVDSLIFSDLGKALAELNHEYKIDLVDCNLRNFIIAKPLSEPQIYYDSTVERKLHQKYRIYLMDFEDAIFLKDKSLSMDFYRFLAHFLTIDGGFFDPMNQIDEGRKKVISDLLSRFISGYEEERRGYIDSFALEYQKSLLVQEIINICIRRKIAISESKIRDRLKEIDCLAFIK